MRPFLEFFFRLLIGGLLVFFLVFLAFAVLPIDPARAVLGPLADAEAVRELNKAYGFDRPVPERLSRALAAVLRGDFGLSITWGQPISGLLGTPLVISLGRLFVALSIGFAVANLLLPIAMARGITAIRTLWIASVSLPSFVVLVLLLAIFGGLLGLSPSSHPWVYEFLTLAVASLYSASVVALSCRDRLDFGTRRSRQAELLMHLHAPPLALVSVLMRGARPTALAALANAATGTLTTITFSEYVFGLPGFAVVFFRACEQGDLAVVAFGSLFLAWSLLLIQGVAGFASQRSDQRLAQAHVGPGGVH